MLILNDSRKPERATSDYQGQLSQREQQAKVSNFVKLHQNCVLQALSLLLVEKIPLIKPPFFGKLCQKKWSKMVKKI